LLKRLNSGDKTGAAREFGRWVHGTIRGRKVRLPGLVRRRRAEAELFLERTGAPSARGPAAGEVR
jgi:lysozyme